MNTEALAINVRNGTLRLARERKEIVDLECPDPDIERKVTVTTWHVRLDPHRREDCISQLMPVTYDPNATCPKWLAFIERVQPKERVRRFLQIYHGYALTALMSEQTFPLNWGLGANGKSTFLETIAALMGNYAAVLPASVLAGNAQKKSNEPSPELARLLGVRFVRAAELPRGKDLHEETIKLLTGGEKLLVRHMHKPFFELQPTFKAVGSGNTKPKITGIDEGIWRRVRLIPWEMMIPVAERKSQTRLFRDFQREWPGILNWLLEGLLIYLEEGGLKTPFEIQEATDKHRAERDKIGQFITDCVRIRKDGKVSANAMFDAYVAWCRANAITAANQTVFGTILGQKNLEKDRKGPGTFYIGVELENVPVDTSQTPHGPGREP